MDINKIIEEIDSLKKYVQKYTHSYRMDSDCTNIVDEQLNGYLEAILVYCRLNNLNTFEESLNKYMPIEANAIQFFSLWGFIKDDIVAHTGALDGLKRQQMIAKIGLKLQGSMSKEEIDIFFNGYPIILLKSSYVFGSLKNYVETTLKSVDGIIIMKMARDLNLISPDVLEINIDDLSLSEFIVQQINKCKLKMNADDYDGAITNARTLIEEVLLTIEENVIGSRQSYEGNLQSLYKRVSKLINMYPDDTKTNNSFNEILRGFISIISGFSGISNNIADRHATSKHPQKHHAKIAVNSAMIISEFILESYDYQKKKLSNGSK